MCPIYWNIVKVNIQCDVEGLPWGHTVGYYTIDPDMVIIVIIVNDFRWLEFKHSFFLSVSRMRFILCWILSAPRYLQHVVTLDWHEW